MTLVCGVDCGLSVTKAVVYDESGIPLGHGERSSPQATPHPEWVERDTEQLWQATALAIKDAVASTGRRAAEIAAVGLTGHGDGLYCVKADRSAARPGISSMDSRATDIEGRWLADGTASAALSLTGQHPMPSSPITLLRWLFENEPKTLDETRWLLFCKDWIKLKLTDEASTDPTEASTSFTNVATQAYDDAVLALFELESYADRLPPVQSSWEIGGHITPSAAQATGLAAGTPVVTGLHDVDASAVGSGAIEPGQLSVIAGTYSINQVVARTPRTDPRWFARNFLEAGTWQHMSVSPASTSTLDWFVQEVCRDLANRSTAELYATLAEGYNSVADENSDVVFLPYLYGAPAWVRADAAFIGLKGWHRREHLLRALLEGVVFNHRRHIDALAEQFDINEVRLTGGASRATHWAQLFADALNRPLRVMRIDETGALGAGLCALVGLGHYSDVASAVSEVLENADNLVLEPRAKQHARLNSAYQRFLSVTDALTATRPASSAAEGDERFVGV
jgi:L-xylulokinase